MHTRTAPLLLPAVLASSPALAATLEVGPGRALTTPCAAAAVASDGDTIQIDAGTYTGDVCAWTADGLTIEGVGGYAHLEADGEASGGKAIWVIQGDRTTVRWVEFSGATVPDRNGAGIRQEGAGLTVSHCWFHDNENGILAGDNDESDILIEHSVFERNGYGDGYSHNLYINHVRSLVFQYNHSEASHVGHQLKSRAYETVVAYNRLADGPVGDGSYQIDLPNGGEALVIGNLIQQGPLAENSGMLSFAAEGATNPEQSLVIVSNTFVNEYGRGTFVRNAGEVEALLFDNLFVGEGTVLEGAGVETASLVADASVLNDAESGDYSLVEGSPAIDAGVDPGALDGVSLWPAWQVSGQAEVEERPVVGALDIGALEYGEASLDTGDSGGAGADDSGAGEDSGGAGGDDGDDGDEGGDDGAGEDSGAREDTGGAKDGPGCGCASGGRGPGAGLALLGLTLLAARRAEARGIGSPPSR